MEGNYRFKLIISFLLLFSTLGQAQDIVPTISYTGTPKKYEIAGIEVVGVENLDPKILINISGLRIGQKITVPGDEVSEAIRKYWKHGLFSDVEIRAAKIVERTIFLEIKLVERPRLSDITFHGLKKSEIETVSEKVAMMKGSQVTPFMVDRAEKYVTDYFVGKGFYNTEVDIIQKDDSAKNNFVILDIYVDKKEKVKVKSLVFEGNEALTDAKLNKVMKKTNEKGKILNFFRTKKFILEDYEKDLVALTDKYNELGYRDMRLVSQTVTKNLDNTVDVHIKVEEGNVYYFGDITWVGNSIYTTQMLNYRLRIKKGDVYNQKYLDERLTEKDDAVHNLYMDNGYLFSNINPVEMRVENDTIDLEMRIYEGQQATINEVIIKGNTKTHEQVVRREIRTKPGQLFSKSELIRTIRELAQLGHFDPEKISPDVRPNQDNGTVDLVYNLEEKANDQIELSGGYGAGMFVGSLGLKFSNFSMRNFFNGEAWRPLPTGDGQTLALRAQLSGQYYQSYSISFTEPWFGGKKPNSLSFSVYHSIQTGVNRGLYNQSSNYGYSNYYSQANLSVPDQHMKITGASLGFGKRLRWPDDWFQLYTEVSYQHYDLKDWNYFIFNDGQSNNLNFKVILSRRSIDNPIYTRSGSDFSVGLEFTPPWSKFSDKDWSMVTSLEEKYQLIEYHKWTFKGAVFKPIDNREKLVVMGKMEMGFLGYYNEYLKSPFEKFVLGGDGMAGYNMYGSQTVGLRGYKNGSLTAVDKYGSRDGNVYEKLTLEVRYPLTLNPSATVFALTFLEAGNSWSTFDQFNPFELKRSAGVGLRIFLPMFGLMGIDWGHRFDDSVYGNDAGGNEFHFVMGQSF